MNALLGQRDLPAYVKVAYYDHSLAASPQEKGGF
jgi:hypothetical protein